MPTSIVAMRTSSDSTLSLTTCIIIEIGNAFLHAGFGDESEPRVEIPLNQNVEASYYFDDNSTLSESCLCLRSAYLSEREWEIKLSPLLEQVYRKLLVRSQDFRVVLILPPSSVNTSQDERRKSPLGKALERTLLEYLQVPAISYIDADRAVSFALDRIESPLSSSPASCSLLLVDIGRYEARCVCLYNGATLFETLQIMPCGYDSLMQRILLHWNHLYSADGIRSSLNESPSATDWDYQYAQFLIRTFHIKATSASMNAVINRLHQSSSMNGVVESVILEKIVHGCVYDCYFSFDNPHSLLRGFLDTALACPIDFRIFMLKNVVFMGESVLKIPNIEENFYNHLTQLFSPNEKISTRPVNDVTWSKYHSLQPSLLPTPSHFTATNICITSGSRGLSILFPLPFLPTHVVWLGGAIIGCMMSSSSDRSKLVFVNWITVDPIKV